jgi:uncharacterized protein YqgQ
MGYDFNQLLKTYVYIFDITEFVKEKDMILIEKIDIILNQLFGKGVFNIIALPSEYTEGTVNLYVGYDKETHHYGESFVYEITVKTFAALGMKVPKTRSEHG